MLRESVFEMLRDIACHQCRTKLLRFEYRHLFVQRADLDALLVIQHRAVDRTRNVVFGEFAG